MTGVSISTKFKLMSTDSATVSEFQPFTGTNWCPFSKFRDVITQLHENSLTHQTLKSVQPLANYGTRKKDPPLLIYRRYTKYKKQFIIGMVCVLREYFDSLCLSYKSCIKLSPESYRGFIYGWENPFGLNTYINLNVRSIVVVVTVNSRYALRRHGLVKTVTWPGHVTSAAA
jgi:hypothetical protein